MKYFATISSDSDMKLGKGRKVGFIDNRASAIGLFDCLVTHSHSELATQAMTNAVVKCLHRNERVFRRYAQTHSFSHRIRTCLVIEQCMRHAMRACRRTRKDVDVDTFMDPRLTMLVLAEHHAIMAYNTTSGVYRVRDGKLNLLTAPSQLKVLPQDHPARMAQSPSDARWILDTEKSKREATAIRSGNKIKKRLPFDMLITDVQLGDSFILASDGLMEYLGYGKKFEHFSVEGDCAQFMDGLISAAVKSGISGVIAGVLLKTLAYERDITGHLIDKAKRLQQLHVFKNLSAPDILRILQFMKMADFEADQQVVLEGQRHARFYIVLSGQLEVRKNAKRIATLRPGDCFGEMALVGQGQRYTDVVGKNPGKFLTISSDRFRHLCAAEPHISSRFLTSILLPLNERINKTADKLSMALASIEMISENARQFRPSPTRSEHSGLEHLDEESILKLIPDIDSPKAGRFADKTGAGPDHPPSTTLPHATLQAAPPSSRADLSSKA